MQNILYKSSSILPWDTQSAFKIKNYHVTKEENTVFCYLKGYVLNGDLILCCYNFIENPNDNNSMYMYLNLNPELSEKTMEINFGYNGISSCKVNQNLYTDIKYNTFKANDEQGFYWCGEITISAETISKIWNTSLNEKSIISLNMMQKFTNGDFSALGGKISNTNYNPTGNMEIFVILNY